MHLLLASPEPHSSASGHLPHARPHLPTIPLSPCPKELASPTWLLQPGPPLRTTCSAIISGTFAPAPARGHSQVQEDHERLPEADWSIPGLRIVLAGRPGAHGAVSTGPAVRILRTAGTMQPQGGTPGEGVTLYVVEVLQDHGALVDRDDVGIP